MTEKEFKIIKLQNRIRKLSSRPESIKAPGVLKKLKSKLKTLESK